MQCLGPAAKRAFFITFGTMTATMTREQQEQEQKARLDSMCWRFLYRLAIDHEIVEWSYGQFNEPKELCMECRSRMKELGWGSEHISPEELREAIEDELREEPLSVMVGTDEWFRVGEALEPNKFELLISTGGPAMRVVGSLCRHGVASDAVVQWQDWFKPWTEYNNEQEALQEALEWFCNLFYFGDC